MGVDAVSSQTIGVKTGRSTSEWHNFCIQTPIDTLLAPLERYFCVEEHGNVRHKSKNFHPQKKSFYASKRVGKFLEPVLPLDVFFPFEAENSYSGLHTLYVLMQLKELIHPK